MKFFLFLIILSVNGIANSQNLFLKVPLQQSLCLDSNFVPISYGMKKTVLEKLYTFPRYGYISSCVFERPQNSYQVFFDYKNKGLISDSISDLIIAQKKLGQVKFENYENDHTVAIFVAITHDKNLIFVPDLNNNNDFSDDLNFTISIDLEISKRIVIPNLKFNMIEYSMGQGFPIELLSIPYDIEVTLGKNGIGDIQMRLLSKEVRVGTIGSGANSFSFSIQLIADGKDFVNYSDILISYGNIFNVKESKLSDNVFYQIRKDTALVNDYSVALDSVSAFGDTAYFYATKNKKGFDPVTFISSLKAINLKTSVLENVFKNPDLTIVDIWATWCAPCLKQHKLLKNLYPKEIGNKNITIKGFLYDKVENIAKANLYLKKSGINWSNYHVNPFNKDEKINLLKISTLPTYLLINNQNEIILRTSNLNTLINVLKKYKKSIDML